MKKQLLFMMFIAIAVMTFTSCSSSDEATNEQGNQLKLSAGITAQKEPYNIGEWGTEIQIGDIEAAIAKEFKVDTAATRTPSDDSNWQGMTDRNIAVKVGSTVYQYSVDASGNLTSNTPYYFTTTSNVSVSSWYPYTSESLSSFSVQSDQISYANREKSDLLYGATTVNQGSANLISYSHKVAKLIVSVKVNNTQHIANGTISKLTMSGIKLSGTFSDGTLTASGNNGTITLHNTIASSTSNNNSTATFEAYLIPQTTTSTFVVSVGGLNFSIAVPSKTFTASKIHTLELIYNVAGSGTENGHAWVRMGTSVKWATMNVGATSVGGIGKYYAWGEITPKTSFTSSNYTYYNHNYDISPTSGHDTARENWRGGWRMPTAVECKELDSLSVSSTVETINSVVCIKYIGKNGNTLYIPACGEYNVDGAGCSGVGDMGDYWTSSYSSKYGLNGSSREARFGVASTYVKNGSRVGFLNDGEGRDGGNIRPVCD